VKSLCIPRSECQYIGSQLAPKAVTILSLAFNTNDVTIIHHFGVGEGNVVNVGQVRTGALGEVKPKLLHEYQS
jgi:hypothetical protein